MVIILIHNPETGQTAMHLENAAPEQALAVLQNAAKTVGQQLAGPKIHLPNGQTKVVQPQQQPTGVTA